MLPNAPASRPSRRLPRVFCAGCGRACYLNGKSHPEVRVVRSGLADAHYCTRACADAHRADWTVSL